jgi:predicted RNase H-like HicB family nuclease
VTPWRGWRTRKYTILLTETSEDGIHVSVPALPDCTVEAETRDDAIRLAREAIASILSRSEIVQVDVSQPPKAPPTRVGIPWEWFGASKDNVTWDALFNEIERNREATRGAQIKVEEHVYDKDGYAGGTENDP